MLTRDQLAADGRTPERARAEQVEGMTVQLSVCLVIHEKNAASIVCPEMEMGAEHVGSLA